MAASVELFDKAEEAVAGNEELLERVRICRMPLVYARWFPRNGYEIEDGVLKFKGDLAKPDEMTAFAERMAAHGFINVREWGGSPEELALYAMVLNTPIPLPSIKNEHLTVDVVPFMGARALRIIHNATGECITAYNVVPNLVFPFGGGEDTRVGVTFAIHEGGPMVQAEVLEVSENKDAITLGMTARGLKIERHIALAPDRPAVVFTTTAQPGDQTRRDSVKSHLELTCESQPRARIPEHRRRFHYMICGHFEGHAERAMFHPTPIPCPQVNGRFGFEGSQGEHARQETGTRWAYALPRGSAGPRTRAGRIERGDPAGESVYTSA